MSTYYDFYLDGIVKGKRISLVPLTYNIEKNKYGLSAFYYGQSILGETYDKILEIGGRVPFDSLPDDLKRRCKRFDDDDESRQDMPEYLRDSLVGCKLEDMRRIVPKDRMELHGYVLKDSISAYTMGETDFIEPVNIEEYNNMSPEEKRLYEYFEWDDNYGFVKYFKELIVLSDAMIELFESANYYSAELSDARVICLRS